MAIKYSNPSLVHLRLKHRGNIFFSVGMEEKIALQGRCCVQAKIKVQVCKQQRPRLIKENCTLFVEVLTKTNLLYEYLLPAIPIRFPLSGHTALVI